MGEGTELVKIEAGPTGEVIGGLVEVPAENETAEEVERPYQLRNLKDKDLFPLLKILRKIDIKEFKDAFFQTATGEKTVKEIGYAVAIDMAAILIDNLEKAEDEIYAFWSELSGLDAGQIKEMEFGTLPLMIMDTFSQARSASFFRVLSRFL